MMKSPSVTFLFVSLISGCSLIQPPQNVAECPVPEKIEAPAEVQICPEPQVVERIVTKIVEVPAPQPKPVAAPPATNTAGKLHLPIVGAIEWAKIEPADIWLEARIDTGAESTSVHAEDIQLVEKDGKRFVRFVLVDPKSGNSYQQEIRLRRRVIIKQTAGPSEKRYVVKMWVTLGDVKSRIDVNLSDRKDFEFPLLIGRNFLTDAMIVDVSRHHTKSTPPNVKK